MSKRLSRSEMKALLTGLGNKVTLQRNLKGYSVEQLALKCNMDTQHLLDIEAGKINIMLTTLNQIANELGIDDRELMP